MTLNSLQVENFSLSLDYYNSLKNINDNLIIYLKDYKSASIQYNQKIQEIGNIYDKKIEKIIDEIKSKKNLDFTPLLNFTSSIEKIIQSYNENLAFFIDELEKELKIYENYNPDLVVPTCVSQFKEMKDNIIKKEKEIKNLEKSFLNDMACTEDIIYKYYLQSNDINNNIKIDNNEKSSEHLKKEKNQKNIITEEIINKHINNSKQIEKKYKKQIEEGRNEENKFVTFSRFYSESVKKVAGELYEKLKHLILNFLISIKNNWKIPQTEIDSILPDLVKLDTSVKIEQIIEQYHHSDNNFKSLFNIEKYVFQDIKEIKKNKNNKNEKNKIEDKKIFELDDGFENMYFIEDEITFLTLKKMINNFELINLNKLDIKIEEEKIKMNKLTLKLLSNLIKEKNYKKDESEIFNVSDEDIKRIKLLLEKHHNIVIFLQQLNKFRSTGKLIMGKKIFTLFGKLFNLILDKVKKDKDIYSWKNIIILSQTYYLKNGEKKEYLQNLIMNHEIFKDRKFWEELFIFEMTKEIQKISNMEINNEIETTIEMEKIREFNRNKYSKLAFGQIMTISTNMLEFGLNPDEIYKIIEPKIKYYQLSQDLINTIKSILFNTSDIEEINENKNINNNNQIIIAKDNEEKEKKKEIEKKEKEGNNDKIKEDNINLKDKNLDEEKQ